MARRVATTRHRSSSGGPQRSFGAHLPGLAGLAFGAALLLAAPSQGLGEAADDTWLALAESGIAAAREGDLDLATQKLDEAIALARTFSDGRDARLAASLHNKAFVLALQGDEEAAHELYLQALALRREVVGPRAPGVADTLNNLAELERRQGASEAALEHHEEALAIRREQLGEDHPATAQSLHNLATLMADMGQLGAADEMFDEALGIRRAKLGNRHGDTIETLAALGMVARRRGEAALAEARLAEAASLVAELERPPADMRYRIGLAHGRALLDLGRPREAVDAFEELIAKDAVPDDSARIALYRAAGQAHFRLGEVDEAARRLMDGLALAESGDDDGLVVELLYELVEIQLAQGDLEGAETNATRALDTEEARLSAGDPRIATALNNLAIVQHERGKPLVAEASLKRAVAIEKAAFGEDAPERIPTLENYQVVLSTLERFGEVEAIEDLLGRLRDVGGVND